MTREAAPRLPVRAALRLPVRAVRRLPVRAVRRQAQAVQAQVVPPPVD